MKVGIMGALQARSVLAICAFFLCAATAFAQAGRGSISGTVTDPSGAIVPAAKLTLLNQATGPTQHSVSSSAGVYSFVSLNPGEYQVAASHTGFSSLVVNKVIVNVDQVTEANIKLQVGAAAETVTVTDTSDLVETSNSPAGLLIGGDTI